MTITTPGRTASRTGTLVVGVNVTHPSTLAFAQATAAILTHHMGVGGVTSNSATFRARTDRAAELSWEWSTAGDFSGSTVSVGVPVDESTDFTGGVTVTGLPENTQIFWRPLVNGRQALRPPFPSFVTSPADYVDAAISFLLGSCQTAPDHGIFAAMAAEGSPRFLIHAGDFGYVDSTVLSAQRSSYKAQYRGDFDTFIARTMWLVPCWSDHDYGGNNEDGDLRGKENSLQAFQEFRPVHELANARNGIWHKFTVANCEFFVMDLRYQREGSRPRYPNTGPGTWVSAEEGSGGATIVLPSTPTDNRAIISNNWYCDIQGNGVYRVEGYDHSTRMVKLREAVPGLRLGSRVSFKRASMLDMDAIVDGQTEWLITNVNQSPARWQFIVSDVLWNPTFSSSGADDSWGGWDTERFEQRYIVQRITKRNVIVLSGDRHYSAIDNGTNSRYPEILASPLNNTNIRPGGGGTFSHGTYSAGRSYARIDVGITPHEVTLTVRDATGTTARGVTALTVRAV